MIPVLPMPALPDPGRYPGLGPDIRASDADRDVAVDILCAAVADGRLTLAELDERLEGVLSARTLRDIARRIAGLSRSGPSGAVPPAPAPPVPAVHAAVRGRPPAGNRWSLLQSLLATAGGAV